MSTTQLAELVATHLWITLLIITSTLLLLAWGGWYSLETWGSRVGARVSNTWQGVRLLGFQALLSGAFAVFASVLFFEIANEIGADEDLGRFDIALSAAFSQHASDEQLRTFALITHLGAKSFLVPLAVIVAVLLITRRETFTAAAWVVACALGGLLNSGLKEFFERARPEHLHAFATASGWSFPSGHSSGAIIVYGLLGYLAVLHTPRSVHIPVAAIAMALVVCVGSSRVVLQVHYFSDVLAGYAFGAAWVAAWIAGLEIRRLRVANRNGSGAR